MRCRIESYFLVGASQADPPVGFAWLLKGFEVPPEELWPETGHRSSIVCIVAFFFFQRVIRSSLYAQAAFTAVRTQLDLSKAG